MWRGPIQKTLRLRTLMQTTPLIWRGKIDKSWFFNRRTLSQQQTRPIAYIQWHLHNAVLLGAAWMDCMDDIDNKEINLASKSTDLDKRKIPIASYLKSDRFGHVWASEWFEGILRPPELWNQWKIIRKHTKYWQFLTKSLYFLMCCLIFPSKMLIVR